MAKELMKGSILFGPVPAVLVSSIDDQGQPNIFTVGWVGVACTNPPMITIAVRKERMSHKNIVDQGEFVINIPTKDMVKIVDFCGCRGGNKVDKIKHFSLELEDGVTVSVPSLKKCPVALECKVVSVTELGTHDLFLAEILQCKVETDLIDEGGKIHLSRCGLLAYAHGEYFALNAKPLATFGYSVAKKSKRIEVHKQMQKSRPPVRTGGNTKKRFSE